MVSPAAATENTSSIADTPHVDPVNAARLHPAVAQLAQQAGLTDTGFTIQQEQRAALGEGTGEILHQVGGLTGQEKRVAHLGGGGIFAAKRMLSFILH